MPQIGVSVSQKVIDELDAEAKRTDRSRSQVAARRIEGAPAETDALFGPCVLALEQLRGMDAPGEDGRAMAIKTLRAALAPFETAEPDCGVCRYRGPTQTSNAWVCMYMGIEDCKDVFEVGDMPEGAHGE